MKLRYILPIIVGLIIIAGLAGYDFLTRETIPSQRENSESTTPSSTVSVASSSQVFASLIPIDIHTIFSEETNLYLLSKSPLVNTSTGVKVEFRDNRSRSAGSNIATEVYINGVIATGEEGLVNAEGVKKISFSPDNKYLAFVTWTNNGCAGSCLAFNLSAIDLLNKKIIIGQHMNKTFLNREEFNAPSISQFSETMGYIESYQWIGDHSLKVIQYSVGFINDRANHKVSYYQVSAKETWRYDL